MCYDMVFLVSNCSTGVNLGGERNNMNLSKRQKSKAVNSVRFSNMQKINQKYAVDTQ